MNTQGRELFSDSKTIYVDLCLDIYRLISFKLGVAIETMELYIFISV